MWFFYDLVIDPLLNALQPQRMLEVGAGPGALTQKLMRFCADHQAQNTRLLVVDPRFQFDVAAVKQRYGPMIGLFEASSLQVLPALSQGLDVVFLQGDPNWYTVFHELMHLQSLSRRHQTPFPLVFIHHVSWPYGRRDAYHYPDHIPELFRKPYRRKGLLVGIRQLAQRGGLYAQTFNAETPFGEKNGVMTAIEDFMKTAAEPLLFKKLDGMGGLGILVSQARVDQCPELKQVLGQIQLTPMMARYVQLLERERLQQKTELVRAQAQIGDLEAEQLLNQINSKVALPQELDITPSWS